MRIFNSHEIITWRKILTRKPSGLTDEDMEIALNTIEYHRENANHFMEHLNKVELELQELRDDIAQPAEDLDGPSWWDGERLVNPLSNNVQSPAHYALGYGLEVIDVIKNRTKNMTGHQSYLAGNSIKYLLRFPFKGEPVEDLRKCRYHIDALIEELS